MGERAKPKPMTKAMKWQLGLMMSSRITFNDAGGPSFRVS
jgi:hypothetical protein